MNDTFRRLNTRLLIFFWCNLLFFVSALLFILYVKGPDVGVENPDGVVFERYAIIITLACIPLALKFYHSQYKKIQQNDEEPQPFLKKYVRIYVLRTLILDLAIIANIAGIYVFGAKNFIFMTIITLFALLFCFPNKSYLEPKADTDIEENINNEQI